MIKKSKPKITLFHCINSFDDPEFLKALTGSSFELKEIKMACSGMVKDVFLLRAFEAGADAVAVFVCPEGECRYLEGNIRAKKRVGFVKNLLEEIGLGGRRLSIHNIKQGDSEEAGGIFKQILSEINEMGPSPVK
jgi:coenzyme F420-reducing hydrogenase delta subunit